MHHGSHETGPTSPPLIGETIGVHFDRTAEHFAENLAVVSVHQRARMTYAQLKAATDRFARGLIALGVQHGERVGIWSTNNLEWVIAQFGSPKIGAILVSLNPAYRTHDLKQALNATGVSVLLLEPHYKANENLAMVAMIRHELPALRCVVLLGDTNGTPVPRGSVTWRS